MSNVLADILTAADALTDSTQLSTTVHRWDRNRNKKLHRHTVVLPGLLAQLYESVIPAGEDTGRRTAPSSRPPLALEALSTHTVITLAASKWCWDLRIDQRDTVEQNIRALVGRASTLDSDLQHRLRADLRRWRTWCAVMTGWERVDTYPTVPCPRCDRPGSLRVNLTTERGFCTNPDRGSDGKLVCGSVWEMQDGSLTVLGRYIRAALKRADKETAA